MLGFRLYCLLGIGTSISAYVQVHKFIRVECRCAVASLWLAPACSSAILLGTDTWLLAATRFNHDLGDSAKYCDDTKATSDELAKWQHFLGGFTN